MSNQVRFMQLSTPQRRSREGAEDQLSTEGVAQDQGREDTQQLDEQQLDAVQEGNIEEVTAQQQDPDQVDQTQELDELDQQGLDAQANDQHQSLEQDGQELDEREQDGLDAQSTVQQQVAEQEPDELEEDAKLDPNQQAVQASGRTLSGAMNRQAQDELEQDDQRQAPDTLKEAGDRRGQQDQEQDIGQEQAPSTLKEAGDRRAERSQEQDLSPNEQALKAAPPTLAAAMNLRNQPKEAEAGKDGKGKEQGELSRPTHESYYQPVPVNGMAPPERRRGMGRGL